MADGNRVLNFSEFGKKYSQDAANDAAADFSKIETAADEFQEGFDQDSYEDGQAAPQRPLNTGTEETPPQPGEESVEDAEGIAEPTEEPIEEAPEGEEVIEEPVEGEETEEVEEAPEGEEVIEEPIEGEEVEEAPAEDDDEDYGNPEDGDEDDEDDEEETNEARISKEFTQGESILESFDEFSRNGSKLMNKKPQGGYDEVINDIELDFEEPVEATQPDSDACIVTCKSCGAEREIEPGVSPFGRENEENPDSWWQGHVLGMQCGCNDH